MGVRLSRTMGEVKVELGQVGSPSGLSSAEVLGCSPVPEVRVVCDNLEGVMNVYASMTNLFLFLIYDIIDKHSSLLRNTAHYASLLQYIHFSYLVS